MTRITATVSLFVEVTDVPSVLDAARQRMIEDGLEEGYVSDFIRDKDQLSEALRMLLDPGSMCQGVEILDSSCEIYSYEDD